MFPVLDLIPKQVPSYWRLDAYTTTNQTTTIRRVPVFDVGGWLRGFRSDPLVISVELTPEPFTESNEKAPA